MQIFGDTTRLVLDLGGVFFFAMSGALLAASKGWRVPLAHSVRHKTLPRDTL